MISSFLDDLASHTTRRDQECQRAGARVGRRRDDVAHRADGSFGPRARGRGAAFTTLRQIAALAPGSTLIMSFMLPIELAEPEVRPGLEASAKGARANGTPFISFFLPQEVLALAREAGFREVKHVSSAALAQHYFAGGIDGLRPPNNSEELLVART
jgi:hypothetical protein